MTPFEVMRKILEERIWRFHKTLKVAQQDTIHIQNKAYVPSSELKSYHESIVAYNESYRALRKEVILYQAFVEKYQCSEHTCDQLQRHGKELLNYANKHLEHQNQASK